MGGGHARVRAEDARRGRGLGAAWWRRRASLGAAEGTGAESKKESRVATAQNNRVWVSKI